jgi:anti-sigma factor RsiW/predicted secreted Zn-dependent protease
MKRWWKLKKELTMVCESWKAKLDTYLDGELPGEMRIYDAHVHSCPSCSADALTRIQMKRTIQVAGIRFTPSAEFRRRMRQSITPKPRRNLRLGWILAVVVLLVGALTSTHVGTRSGRDYVFSEIADLHVATVASSSPVDVISSDRHTVKPWFQGKIPFSFDLPELQSSEFSLLGGRMTYLDQTPGAHLIYDVRKQHISVFVFQERSLRASLDENSLSPKNLPFNMETWSRGGLRYFVIGDVSAADINSLAKLFKTAASYTQQPSATYPVHGATAAEALSNASAVSGFRSETGEPMMGETTGKMQIVNTNVETSVTPGNQIVDSYATAEVKSAYVKLDQTMTLPSWQEQSGASSQEQKTFTDQVSSLNEHEKGHVEIYRQQAHKLDRSLPGIRGSGQAKTPQEALNRAMKDMAQKESNKAQQ